MLVELLDGRVMLNIRNESAVRKRGKSYSINGISSWSKPEYIEDLFEPTCMASTIRIVDKKGRQGLLFINPDSEKLPVAKSANNRPRMNLTAKLSFDEGKSWPVKKVINPVYSGYSDVAFTKDGNVYCLYEIQSGHGNNRSLAIQFKRFNLQWILH